MGEGAPKNHANNSSAARWQKLAGRRLRLARGQLTQDLFAARLSEVWGSQIHKSQISEWETGVVAASAAVLQAAESIAQEGDLAPEEAGPLAQQMLELQQTLAEVMQRIEARDLEVRALQSVVQGYVDLLHGQEEDLRSIQQALSRLTADEHP